MWYTQCVKDCRGGLRAACTGGGAADVDDDALGGRSVDDDAFGDDDDDDAFAFAFALPGIRRLPDKPKKEGRTRLRSHSAAP